MKDIDATGTLTAKKAPTFYFIGVTTSKSSIMRIFPRWMNEIGRDDIVIEGIDCKIHDDAETYRQIVSFIKHDMKSLGGLVTTHKIDLFSASRDLFDFVDPYAEITGEVSSISKVDGRLEGHAKDPITVGLSLQSLVRNGYFGRTSGEILIFGAGGSAVATVLYLARAENPADRPSRIVVVNRSQGRLDTMKRMVDELDNPFEVVYVCNSDPLKNDEIMETMPPNSLVVNATGMGKDTPGSPITDNGIFPKDGIAWEFNYRGELEFLKQALRQRESRALKVEDGWVYFLHGWTQVVAQVLHLNLGDELFQRLRVIAEETTGRAH